MCSPWDKRSKTQEKEQRKKIKIWTLKGEKVTEYRDKVEEVYHLEADTNAEESWKLFKKVVMRAAEEICGATKGGKHLERETWWWNEEVQESLRRKKDAFKKWQIQGGSELKEAYKNMKREREREREAKAAVAKDTNEAYKERYDKMGTEEGEGMIYKVAKQMASSRRDIGEVNVIKDQTREMLIDEVKIKERWREYFSNLLNVENAREQLGEVPAVEGPVHEISREEVKNAIKRMKKGKSPGCSGLPIDLIKHIGESRVDMMHDILKRVWEVEQMPEEWKKSEISPIYKQKGDQLECGNLRGIKLLEHGMKIFEKILERRLRKLITVNNMQFGFSPGKGTTDAVFIIQRLQEKQIEVHKDLFLTFIDLEKAYDRVPRDLVYWRLRRRRVPERLVRLEEATYHGASAVVRTTHGRTDEFLIKVGLHQGSGLSPFLFIVVLYVINKEFRSGLPSELLFADDLAVVTYTKEEMQRKWL